MSHDDPDNTGQCVRCGWIWAVDENDPDDVAFVDKSNAQLTVERGVTRDRCVGGDPE